MKNPIQLNAESQSRSRHNRNDGGTDAASKPRRTATQPRFSLGGFVARFGLRSLPEHTTSAYDQFAETRRGAGLRAGLRGALAAPDINPVAAASPAGSCLTVSGSSKRSLGGLSLLLLTGAIALFGIGLPATVRADDCPNADFREGPSAILPDCRAYELVSPPDQQGHDLAYGVGAPDGVRAWLQSPVPFAEGANTGNGLTASVTRTASGWKVSPLDAPGQSPTLSYSFMAASDDSSQTVLEVCDRAFLACRGDVQYQRVAQDGQRTIMLTVSRATFLAPLPTYVGQSGDASWIFVESPTSLLPVDTHAQGQGLYASHNGQIEFLGLDAAGNALPCGAVLANDSGGGGLGNGFEQSGISADGRTVVFESPDPDAGCPDPTDLYVRRDGISVNISAPRAPNAAPDLGATYVGSSRDGNTVYFVTSSQLETGGPNPDVDSDSDLYMYQVQSDTIERITPDADIVPNPNSGRPQVAVSPDGDYVYFVAARSIGGSGTAGQQNLFVYSRTTATISRAATADGASSFKLGNGLASPSGGGAVTTPDGHHLLFMSNAALTGQPTGGNDVLYQYTLGSSAPVCISCNPNGSTPTQSVDVHASAPAQFNTRFQSDDGDTVFFNASDGLVAQDTNEDVRDVYMWRKGTLSLVSSGRGAFASTFAGASADGNTVFFATYDRLLPDIEQDNLKVYADRVGGGFPQSPGAPAECESADSCHTSLQTQPPATLTSHLAAGEVTRNPRLRLALAGISRTALRRAARSGRLSIGVTANRGTVTLAASAKLNRRSVTLVRLKRARTRPGSFTVRITLPPLALAALRRTGSLRLRIAAHQDGVSATRTLTLKRVKRSPASSASARQGSSAPAGAAR
jgi:hypothetical protein